MFNISVDLYKTVNKTYPKYDIPDCLLLLMFDASKNIFKSSDIVNKKGSCYNIKRELNIIHLYKIFNSIHNPIPNVSYNKFHVLYYSTTYGHEISNKESIGRFMPSKITLLATMYFIEGVFLNLYSKYSFILLGSFPCK